MFNQRSQAFSLFTFLVFVLSHQAILFSQIDKPESLIDGLSIELFSSEPDIVTPTGIAVDKNGRVFCIESHTHFRPKDYAGPKTDRIRIYDDTNGDGKADKVTNFFEGSTATMNMAFAPDGSLYVASRSQIFRLRDKNNDDKADENTIIIDLQTKGDYPHNGLSGLAFDEVGKMYFGFGENLGVDYKLIGTDGTTLSGGGEGGNIYSCDLEGKKLKRIATGFWNPFGLSFDKVGNLFAIDNDPDWRPPCRLLHIVEGGDYGYRFSLGRRGTHPFTAWFGELPGTLGLVSGTGEAPSGILRYDPMSKSKNESVILSTSWGLHSIERFNLNPSGATFTSKPETIIKGGKDFRPVGIASAPDGTIYISDWCKRSYELHGHGRIWKLSYKSKENPAPLTKLSNAYPFDDTDVSNRQRAAAVLKPQLIDFPKAIQAALSPLEKATLIRRSNKTINTLLVISFLSDNDPYVQQAARFALAKSLSNKQLVNLKLPANAKQRLGLALLMRERSDDPQVEARVAELLADEDPEIRFVAIRWIGEKRLEPFVGKLEIEMKTRPLTGRLFESYLAAIDLINNNRPGSEFEKAEANILAEILTSKATSPETLIVALRKLQSVSWRDSFNNNHPKLNLKLLRNLLDAESKNVVREVIQTIRGIGNSESKTLIREIANDRKKFGENTIEAIIGLDPVNEVDRKLLLELCMEDSKLGQTAVQSMLNSDLSSTERESIQRSALPSAARLLKVEKLRSKTFELTSTVQSKLASADADAGRRIFFNSRFGQCAKCHQVDGRGGNVGPDLSNISNMALGRLLESIVEPSKEIAPRHTPILIETYDGKSFSGVLYAERGEEITYADSNGKLIKVRFDDIERSKPQTKSIMPEGLLERMTVDEVADLAKYLLKR